MAESPLPLPEGNKRMSRDVKRLTMSLAVLALQRLADPEVRAQVAAQSRTLAANAKQWRSERSSGSSGSASGLWSERFGRRRLERRVGRLRSSVLALGEGRPELAASLDPVLAALEEVTSALDVAATLPLARRIRALQRVDAILDRLELGLFEVALPQLPS